MRLRPLVAVAVTVGLMAIPASAGASTKTQTVTLTGSGQKAALLPTCAKGQRATGGGFSAPAPSGPLKAIFSESQKVGQRSWRVSVLQSGAGLLPVTAYVYCNKDAPKTTTVATTVPIPATSDFIPADATCASGKAQAGGFFIPRTAGAADLVDSFRLAKKTWRVRAFYQGGVTTATSYVYCAGAGAPKARAGSVSTNMSAAPTAVLSAPCKRGTHVAAGGFSQPNPTLLGLYFDPYELFRSGKSWRAGARHIGTTGSTLSSIAYCV